MVLVMVSTNHIHKREHHITLSHSLKYYIVEDDHPPFSTNTKGPTIWEPRKPHFSTEWTIAIENLQFMAAFIDMNSLPRGQGPIGASSYTPLQGAHAL